MNNTFFSQVKICQLRPFIAHSRLLLELQKLHFQSSKLSQEFAEKISCSTTHNSALQSDFVKYRFPIKSSFVKKYLHSCFCFHFPAGRPWNGVVTLICFKTSILWVFSHFFRAKELFLYGDSNGLLFLQKF